MTTLDEPSVASPYGGSVPAQVQPATRQLVPLRATYRIRIGECSGPATLERQTVGTATIGDARESFAWRGVRAVLAAVEHEADL
jgi:putative peptide zinc metalloprotease protein